MRPTCGWSAGSLAANFVAYEDSFRGGVFVAAGNLSGDARAEIITGPNADRAPDVHIFSVTSGTPGTATQVGNVRAYANNGQFTGGVRVGVTDYNQDGQLDILTGPGPGRGPYVRVFNGLTLEALDAFYAYSKNFTSGIFLGGSD
jgi:hypothetical protein